MRTHLGAIVACVSSVRTMSQNLHHILAANICTESHLEHIHAHTQLYIQHCDDDMFCLIKKNQTKSPPSLFAGSLRGNRLTCVFSCVSDERGGDRERHAAQIALVRFLSRVSPLVIRQRAGLSKCLTTDVTHVRFLPAVQSVENTHRHTRVNKVRESHRSEKHNVTSR